MKLDQLRQALSTSLAKTFGGPVRIERLARLSGGASRETWSFDAMASDGAQHSLILRKDFESGAPQTLVSDEDQRFDRANEYAACRILHDEGVPVPRPICLPDASTGLTESFVMERVDGEALPNRLLHDDAYAEVRPTLVGALGAVAAQIHSFGKETFPMLPTLDTVGQLRMARRMVDLGGQTRPVFELSLRWLEGRVPPLRSGLRLVHGDFRNGNLLVTPRRLEAVLDWEFAHLGDPMEDLAFLCMRPWRFGNTTLEAGGFGSREELFRAYEAAGGERVDPEIVRFWEVLGTLKWGAHCAIRAVRHLSGEQRSVEAAAIGRRVAETECDLGELMRTRP